MNLGRPNLCLNVKDLQRSLSFYRLLGFSDREIHEKEGWAILEYRQLIIGLFQGHIKENLLNFRGGHIPRLKQWLEENQIPIETIESIHEDGSGSFFFRDPDQNLIYMDTMPEELEK